MARVAWLLAACFLALPALQSGSTVITTAAFMAEFLSGGRWPALSAITPEPAVAPLPAMADARPIAADLYICRQLTRARGLVLVHGLSPGGKDDLRLRDAAALLSRTGWSVAVPTIEGLTALRLRPEDATPVSAAIRALDRLGRGPVELLAVSVGAGPALIAAGEPGASAVLVLGGYASAVELLRYTLTGTYRFGDATGRRPVDERAIRAFANANPDLLDGAARRLVDNRDPQAFDRIASELPLSTRRLLEALSPERSVRFLRGPLFLVHGRDDPTVPFTESMRLARAAREAGRPVRAVGIGGLSHVEAAPLAGLREVLELWAVFYAFRAMTAEATSAGRGP